MMLWGRGSRRVKAMLVAIVLETVDCVWSVRCRCQDDGVNGEIDEAIATGWVEYDDIECVLSVVCTNRRSNIDADDWLK